MIIYRIPHAYLYDYARIGERQQLIIKHKLDDTEYQKQIEYAKLMAVQEGHRLLKKYNYVKDTELITQYAFAEGVREQRLIQRASSMGLHVDRYI